MREGGGSFFVSHYFCILFGSYVLDMSESTFVRRASGAESRTLFPLPEDGTTGTQYSFAFKKETSLLLFCATRFIALRPPLPISSSSPLSSILSDAGKASQSFGQRMAARRDAERAYFAFVDALGMYFVLAGNLFFDS